MSDSLISIQNFAIFFAISLSVVTTIYPDINSVYYALYTFSLFIIAFVSMGTAPGPWAGIDKPSIMDMLLHSLPIIPICIITLVLFIIEVNNEDIMSSDSVTPESYTIVKTVNLVFYIITLVMIYSYLEESKKIKGAKTEASYNSKKICLGSTGAAIVFFSSLSAVCTFFMYTIINFFKTDGFTTIN